jgi:hypothetical protein
MHINGLPTEEIVPHFSLSQEETPLETSFKKSANFLERMFTAGYKNDFKIIIYSALPIVIISFFNFDTCKI